jgi:hypothetical protein
LTALYAKGHKSYHLINILAREKGEKFNSGHKSVSFWLD